MDHVQDHNHNTHDAHNDDDDDDGLPCVYLTICCKCEQYIIGSKDYNKRRQQADDDNKIKSTNYYDQQILGVYSTKKAANAHAKHYVQKYLGEEDDSDEDDDSSDSDDDSDDDSIQSDDECSYAFDGSEHEDFWKVGKDRQAYLRVWVERRTIEDTYSRPLNGKRKRY